LRWRFRGGGIDRIATLLDIESEMESRSTAKHNFGKFDTPAG